MAKKRKVSAAGCRQKGSRLERQVVEAFRAANLSAERVPLSGGAGGSFSGDVLVNFGGQKRRIECKSRAKAWKDLYDFLEGNDLLIVKRDNAAPLLVMPLAEFTSLIGGW